jgi:hypothetical protein
MTTRDWKVWIELKTVRLEEAVKLALGLDPSDQGSLHHPKHGYIVDEYFEALRQARVAARPGGIIKVFAPTETDGAAEGANFVSLAEVAALFARIWGAKDLLPVALQELVSAPAGGEKQSLSRPKERQKQILLKIRELGYDPLALPIARGKRGPKKEVKSALGTAGIWTGDTVFKKAWEKLRESKQISDATT